MLTERNHTVTTVVLALLRLPRRAWRRRAKLVRLAADALMRIRQAAEPAVGRARKAVEPAVGRIRQVAEPALEQARRHRILAIAQDRTAPILGGFALLGLLFAGSAGADPSPDATQDLPAAVEAVEVLWERPDPEAAEQAEAEAEAEAETETEEKAEEAEEEPKPPKTVAGLDEKQTANAAAIVETGRDMDISDRGIEVALATALQESQLYNLANSTVPDSLELDNEGVGHDHDSVGLFQQRVSGNWGDLDELMDPHDSAAAFFRGLERVGDWEDMSLARAAQAVQISAFPDAYAKWEDEAEDILDGIEG